MVFKTPSGWRVPHAATLFSLLWLLGGSAVLADTHKVPDLLDLPARADVRAQVAPQLALARVGERVVAVGVRGNVLLSDDFGRNWRQARTVPVSVALTDVHFVGSDRGWAVGHSGVILHSADGGDSWTRQLDGRQAAAIVLDEASARLAGGDPGAARAVRDAQRMVEEGPDKPFLGVHFADDQRGYAVGAYGLALVTEDGGATWHSLAGRIPNARGNHLYQVQVRGRDILIAGEQGVLFRSQDGGESFAAIPTPYAGTYFGVVVIDADTMLAYGLRGNAWRSHDGGQSWVQVPIDQEITLTAGRLLSDGSVVLADESGRLLRSTDGARSFVALPEHPGSGLTGMVETSAGDLVLSGGRGLARLEHRKLVAEAK
ncbi:MAG: YCF48-related protein [Azoarcus sp.]|nr:YCF48-related protein [Azoarcus sp.]